MRKLGVYVPVFVFVCIFACVFGSAANAQPPTDDLVAWYDAASGVITDVNGVTIWEDLAGGENDATRQEAFGPGYPELSCGTFPSGEHAVVNFNGDAGLECAAPEDLHLEEVSVYIVSESTRGGGGNLFTNYSNSINWGYGYIVRWVGNNQPSFFTANGVAETHSDSNSGTVATDGYHVLTGTFSNISGEKRLYLDGVVDLTFDGLQTGLGYEQPESFTRTAIGTFREFGLRRQHKGGIAEILIYGAVDELQRSEVEEYLNDKYFDPGNTPPPLPDLPPTGLACEARLDGSAVTLNWKPCGSYTSQQVLRDGAEIAAIAGDANSFVDDDPPPDATSTYVIEATAGGSDLLSGECAVEVTLPFFEGRIMHLAADQGVISGPNGVQSWVDQSAIGGQQDGFREEGFGTGVIVESCGSFPNGTHPVLSFPGTNDISTGAALGILQPEGLRKRNISIYAVVESSLGAGTILSVYSNSVNWGWGFNLRMQPGGLGSLPCFFTTAGTASTIHDVCPAQDAPEGYHIITATLSSLLEEKKIYIDGVLLDDSNYVPGCTLEDPPCNANFDGRNMGFDGAERPSIGSFREFQDGDGSHRYHTGGIAEIIVYDSVDEDQREMVEAELRAKYFEGQGSANLPPAGLVCTRSADGLRVDLSWANCGAYEALRLFRNGVLIFDLGEDATEFADTFNPPLGDVTYKVEAEFDDGSMDGPSCTVSDPRTVGCSPSAADPRLVLWLDADKGVTSDENGVTRWTDQNGGNDAVSRVNGIDEVGFGNGWAQEDTATFPAGNFPVLQFDGDTGMEVENTADFALGEVAMFVVAEMGPGSGQLITNYNNSVNWGWGWNFHGLGRAALGDATALNLFVSAGTCGTHSDGADGGVIAPAAGNYAVLSATISNTSGSKAIYVDGAQVVSKQLGNPGAAGCGPDTGPEFGARIAYDGFERVGIGSFREFDGGTRAHIGGIAEILIFSTADAQLRESVEAYLITKYITGDSPVDCPDVADPTGACQAAGGGCDIQTQADCEAGGGTYLGDFSTCPVATGFRRGDHDGSGLVDITDPLNLLGFLFLGQTPPICADASDGDNSMALDISDALNVLGFLFLGSFPLNETLPGPTDCGEDPTVEIDPDNGGPFPPQPVGSLGCDMYPSEAGLPCN